MAQIIQITPKIRDPKLFYDNLLEGKETDFEMYDTGKALLDSLESDQSEKNIGTVIRYLAQDKGFNLPYKQSDMLDALNDYHATLSGRSFKDVDNDGSNVEVDDYGYTELNFLQMDLVKMIEYHISKVPGYQKSVVHESDGSPAYFDREANPAQYDRPETQPGNH